MRVLILHVLALSSHRSRCSVLTTRRCFLLPSLEIVSASCAVTHGHIDHVGALSLLLELYPNMKVVIHEAEGPYMEGHKLYFSVEGRSLHLKALHFLEAVPQKQFQVICLRSKL